MEPSQDGVTVTMVTGGSRKELIALLCVILLHTWLFFCAFSIRLLMHSEPSAAYAVRHYAQRGSGTYTDSPGSFREAGCCLLAALSQVGTVCTWSLSPSLGDAKVGIQGAGFKYGWQERAECCCQGRVDEAQVMDCLLTNVQICSPQPVGIAWPQ